MSKVSLPKAGKSSKPIYRSLIEVVRSSQPNLGWSIPQNWIAQIIKDFDLTLAQRPLDMVGTKSALFEIDGVIFRLEEEDGVRYKLYHGEWVRDHRWTGD